MAFDPAVERFLAEGRRLGEVLGKMQAAMYDDLRVRRAAPDEPNIMPEVDGYGELTDLYLEGIVGRYTADQIGNLIMSGLNECYEVLDSRRAAAAGEAVPELAELNLERS